MLCKQFTTLNEEYNLEKRLFEFSKSVILLAKSIKRDFYNSRIISQVIASSGSAGANYCEANESESKKDFVHKCRLTRKELKETLHWLKLLVITNPEIKERQKTIYNENYELLLIFSKITSLNK